MWCLNPLNHLYYSLLYVTKWQRNWREAFQGLLKGGGWSWNDVNLSILFWEHTIWYLLRFLAALPYFNFEYYSWRKRLICLLFNSKIVNYFSSFFFLSYFPFFFFVFAFVRLFEVVSLFSFLVAYSSNTRKI